MSTGPHINYFGLTAYDNKASFFGDTATILPEVCPIVSFGCRTIPG